MTTVGSLVAVVALGLLVDWTGGLGLGLLAGIGFMATTTLQSIPFEDRALPVYLLSVGYNGLALAGAGVLLVVL